MFIDPESPVVEPSLYDTSKTDAPLVNDSTDDAIRKWAEENGYRINDETLDYLYNQYFTEKNDTIAWQRTLEADSGKYQRVVNDLKQAGINPIQVLGGYGGSSPNASAGSVGSGSIASRKNNKNQVTANNATGVLESVIRVAGSIFGALILATLAA